MKRIAITGPECCGKTELAISLHHLLPDSVLVPEFARQYLEQRLPDTRYSLEDLIHIGREQHRLTEGASQGKASVLIADSDYLVLDIWMREVFGHQSMLFSNWLVTDRFDLYLLCSPDIPWTPDPLRSNPLDRDRLFELYLATLRQHQLPFVVIEGHGEARVKLAMDAISTL